MPRSAFLLFAAVTIFACGPSGPEGPHLLYSTDVASLDNPFPDARFAQGDSAALRPGWYTPWLARGALTGRMRALCETYATDAAKEVWPVGTFGGTLLRATEPLDGASFAGKVARLKKVGGGWQVLEPDVTVQHVKDNLPPGVEAPATLPDFVLVRPAVPLGPGEEGLLVVLDGVTTAAGAKLERGREWDAGKPDLAPIAKALGVKEEQILLALGQHGVDVQGFFAGLAAWAEANPVPVTIPAKGETLIGNAHYLDGRWQSTDPDFGTVRPWLERRSWARPSTAVGQVVFGQLAAHDLRENGVIRADWAADPSQAPVVPLRFVLSVPAGAKPAGGWKVVMGQHGVGGRNTVQTTDTNSFCLEYAEILAKKGMGCIGIDAPSHASRGVFTEFFALEQMPVLRDRFREMTFDLLQVERAIPTIDVDGDGAADFSGDVLYFGNSLGAIMGASFVPWANRTTAAVLNVPGGGLSNILVSRNIKDLIGLLMVAKTDLVFDSPEYHAAFPVFRAAAQPFFDFGDGVNVGYVLPAGRAVLVQEGVGDDTIPNATTEDLANAMGLTAEDASKTSTGPLQVLHRVDPAKYLPPSQLDGYNGHNVIGDIPMVRDQMVKFLETDGRELLVQ